MRQKWMALSPCTKVRLDSFACSHASILTAIARPPGGPSSCSIEAVAIEQELGIDGELASWFAQRRPELLHRPMVRLKKRLEGLASLLGCSIKQSASMVQKQEALLDLDSDAIRSKLAGLTAALGGDRRHACATARRMPVLLVGDHVEGLPSHMGRLAAVLSMEGCAEAVRLAIKEPLLLVMAPEEVQRRLEGVACCLELGSMQEAAAICRSHPWMLTVSSSSLASKVQSLGAALHLARSTVLALLRSYPSILSQSERGILNKVAALTEVVPRHKLQAMVCREPSLLMRSCSKILQSLRSVQETTGVSMQVTVDLATRRPGLLAKSPAAPARCYRALSIWKFTKEEKQEMIEAHPLLLQLSPREVHFRCRWLRQLMESNGFYHSALRRLPLSLLGVAILHLPSSWGRLQYLVDSSQEGKVKLTDALQMKGSAFNARFPEYKRWLHFKTSELGCKVPWRRPAKSRHGHGQRQPGGTAYVHLQQASPSSSGRTEAAESPSSWHDAGSVESCSGPFQQTVVSEAGIIYYGMQPVRKPQRVVYMPGPGPGPGPGSSSSGSPEPAGSSGKESGSDNAGPANQLDVVQGCVQPAQAESWEPGNVS